MLLVPTFATEQYPKGLGHTVEEVDVSKAVAVVAKTDFSMIVPDVSAKLAELIRRRFRRGRRSRPGSCASPPRMS